MANGSGGSNALGWAVLGFLAGVAATLAVLVLMGPGHGRRPPAPTEAAAPPPTPKIAALTAPKPAALKPAPVSSARAAVTTTDQQVQEDAAAAGMTSRRQSSEPAPN